MSEEHNIMDYEEVLRVLPEAFRDSWKDNPEVLVYLADLGSLGLQRLNQEPDRLTEEKSSVLEQTQDLAFHNYKTFIQAAECSHKIFQDFNIIESRLDSLINKFPDFKDKCGEFGKEAQKINARWRQASSTLARHPQLLEFLEMSQLMDTYVKNGYYDEALELSSYVKRLERKHIDIPLIKSIVQDVQVSVNLMLSHLLAKLKTNIQLPDCLKVVGYLRRMDVFNESELRIKFLQARDAWFQHVITDIDKTDAYEHVIKIIENSRVYLFDITTQYRAIFSDDDPLLLIREDAKGNYAIFHSWISWKISWFLSVLEKDISADLGGRIDSVLAQCMYFGLSFSRVNIDFRPLLIPIFQNVALKKFRYALEHATNKFADIMKSYTFTSYSNTTMIMQNFSEESLQPPIGLLDVYPLAQFCNDLLSALNELKLCCSYSISPDLINLITVSLSQITKLFVNTHSKWKNRLNEQEKDNFKKLCYHFSSELVPHINKCLVIMFPPQDISQAIGITALEFKKMEYLCRLNVDAILDPLQVILPLKDEDLGLILTIHEPVKENTVPGTDIDSSYKKKVDSSILQMDEQLVVSNSELDERLKHISNSDQTITESAKKEFDQNVENIALDLPVSFAEADFQNEKETPNLVSNDHEET